MAQQTDELIDLCLEVGEALDLRRREGGPIIPARWEKFEDGWGGMSPATPPPHDSNATDWPILISDSLLLKAVHGHEVKFSVLDLYLHECSHAILQAVSPRNSGHGFAFSVLDFSLRLRADAANLDNGYCWWAKGHRQWCSPALYDLQELRGLGSVFEPDNILLGDSSAWKRLGGRIGCVLETASRLASSEMSPWQIAEEAVTGWQQLIKPKMPEPIQAPSLTRAAWNWLLYGSTLGAERA